jgi:hypothetical protein
VVSQSTLGFQTGVGAFRRFLKTLNVWMFIPPISGVEGFKTTSNVYGRSERNFLAEKIGSAKLFFNKLTGTPYTFITLFFCIRFRVHQAMLAAAKRSLFSF